MARRPIHVLHIPKTGGTALHIALQPFAEARGLTLHGHGARLADVPRGDAVVFAVREPVARYVSGFNSRLRKGAPRNDIEWTAYERVGFMAFPTPNAAAEALSDPDLDRRVQAVRLLREVFHIGIPLSYWLGPPAYLRSRFDDLLMVVSQPDLNADFAHLKAILGAGEARLPSDPIDTHVTPSGFDTQLSAIARENLGAWYAGDYPIYETALELRARILARAPAIN